ncbi:MAG: hypothetical protein ACI33P_10835 [Lysinibacillus sp.]
MTQKHTFYKFIACAGVLPVLAIGAVPVAGAMHEEPVDGLQVTGVENKSSTQFTVHFNEPVELEKMSKRAELQKYFKLEAVDGTGKTLRDIPLRRGELSKDGRSYQLTPSTPISASGEYRLRVFGIYSQQGEKLTTYNELVSFKQDRTAPAIESVEWVSKNQSEVIFTEPVKSTTATFKLKDSTKVTGIRSSVDGSVITYHLGNAKADGKPLPDGTEITVTYSGVKDLANNASKPRVLKATIVKGENGSAKLAVTSVEQVGARKFKLTFNHPLVSLHPSDLAVSAGTKKYAVQHVEAVDDHTYIVTVNGTLQGNVAIGTAPSGYVTNMDTREDATFSAKHDFDAHAAGMKIVKTEVIRENNLEYLFVTFDRDVSVSGSTAASFTGTYTEPKTKRKKTVEGKEVKVRAVYNQPAKVKIPLRELLQPQDVENAAYELDISFSNLSYGTMDGGAVSFGRTKDYAFNGEQLQVVAVNTSLTDASITDPRFITIDFNQPVDETVASRVSNYEVRGYRLGQVQVNPSNPKQVILKIEGRGYWWYVTPYLYMSGLRADGSYEVMADYYEPIALPDVVAPHDSYWNPTLTMKYAMELVLTFGQSVSISDENDFIVTDRDGTSYGAKAYVDPANARNVILSLSKPLPNYATITVRLKDGRVIRDMYQNPGTFEEKSLYISTWPWYPY